MMSASTATRSRLRRAARALFALVLALAIVALFGLVFLHSLPGRLAVKTFLEGLGSTAAGGTLRLGQLDLALWKGHAAVTALNASDIRERLTSLGFVVIANTPEQFAAVVRSEVEKYRKVIAESGIQQL